MYLSLNIKFQKKKKKASLKYVKGKNMYVLIGFFY